MTTRPLQVERVLDEELTVLVSVDPEQVVDALTTRLTRMHGPMMLMRQLPPQHPASIEARRQVIEALGSVALQVTLDRAAAVALIDDLEAAAREPVRCAVEHCESLADDDFCPGHIDAGAGTPSRWTA